MACVARQASGKLRPIEQLEDEITELAAHIHAATYRFLCLLRELDERQGWAGDGIKSCAHWLNWKIGLSLVAARDKLRVAHALSALPQISESFSGGKLSYSKVRALTRIATPENEAELLNIAEHGTAHHVEKLVRLYRRSRGAQELREERGRHQARYLRYHWDEDGMLLLDGRLPPETGALLEKALEAAAEQLSAADDSAESRLSEESTADDSAESSDSSGPQDGYAQKRADALVVLAERALAGASGSLAGAHQVVVHIDAEVLSNANAEGRSELEDGPNVAPELVRRLSCDCGVVTMLEDENGKTLDVGRKTRSIPSALRRALRARDDGCRWPGCTTRFVDGHHIHHWADGGETKLDNLVQLCRHHHRSVHEGGYHLELSGDGVLSIKTPAGKSLPKPPRPPHPSLDGVSALRAANEDVGLRIDATTCIPEWQGDEMDYEWAVMGLLPSADK